MHTSNSEGKIIWNSLLGTWRIFVSIIEIFTFYSKMLYVTLKPGRLYLTCIEIVMFQTMFHIIICLGLINQLVWAPTYNFMPSRLLDI
jgi:hypothetical protein